MDVNSVLSGVLAGFLGAVYRNDDFDRQEAANFRGIALYLTKPLPVVAS